MLCFRLILFHKQDRLAQLSTLIFSIYRYRQSTLYDNFAKLSVPSEHTIENTNQTCQNVMNRDGIISKYHRGIFSLINIGMGLFFTIAVVVALLAVNVGFEVIDTEKQVVREAVSQVDEHLKFAGDIIASADVPANKLTTTATPVRPVPGASVNIDPQIMDISYKLIQLNNYTVTYNNINAGNLNDTSYNSLSDAVADAKQRGLIDIDPFVDNQKPTTTTAFVYWIINQNFDQQIDSDELAVIAIVYADKDRPTTEEYVLVQANVPEGYLLKMEKYIPDITGSYIKFGGKIKNP